MSNPAGVHNAVRMYQIFIDGGYKCSLYVGEPELLSSVAVLFITDGAYFAGYYFREDGTYFRGTN